MVSMKDIARECGVSVATVSKALGNHQDIGEETKARIHEKAKELGYTGNSAARALKTNRTYNIGVLFVDSRRSGLAHEYFSSVLDSLRVEAERRGYDITFICGNVGGRKATYLQHSRYRGVDGVVIACVDFNDPMVRELVDSDLPVVTIDHVFNNRVAVVSDNVVGVETLVAHAVACGHRNIGFIHGEQTTVTENRLLGFYRACEKAGLRIPEENVMQGMYHDTQTCYELTKKMLSLPNRPTCLLFPDDFSCIGGLNAIREAGLSVPRDISVMGYDGIGLSQVVSPRLTTYRQNTEELGMTAAARLVELIERPRTALLDRVIVQGQLLDGDSVARI